MHNLHLFFLIAKNINMTNMNKKEAYKKLYNCKIDVLDKELNNFLTFKNSINPNINPIKETIIPITNKLK